MPVEAILTQLVGWVVTSFLGACGGVLLTRARKSREEDAAMRDGMRSLLRSQLVEMHHKYVVEGQPCSVDEHDNAEQVYKAYHALGGNGTGTHLYQEIMSAHVAG